MRRFVTLFCAFIALAVGSFQEPLGIRAQPKKESELFWIWSDDATLASAPDGSRFFRKSFEVKGKVAEAKIEITADNHFTLWINDQLIGNGDEWSRLEHFDVAKHLKPGRNLIAVEGRNDGASPAGLIARLDFTDEVGKQVIRTDKTWKAAKSVAGDGWRKTTFDDVKWEAANPLAPFGGGPWAGVSAKGPPAKRGFTVPADFRVETVIAPGTKITGEANAKFNISFVNMCFDAKGRLLLAQEGGPIVRAAEPNEAGIFQKLIPYCEQVKNCHGMCWVNDALILVGDGPKGTGLYRCTDTKHVDQVDKVDLLLKFRGGMGEHGPHAVIHGPDNHLYLVIGNHAWAEVDKLADNAPLKRWPKGVPVADQGKPGTTEDVLLPRLNDANGHAANILAPGGTIWRLDANGKNPVLFSAGFRNQFDAAFNPAGELFTFDSDMEWDEGLPWYRHVRVSHCTPGADFVWRTGAANTPNYYADSLPPLVETGRGSPTGVECYDHSAFPAKYRGAIFLCDWSIGVLWCVHPERSGASYKATAEKFCTGAPMPISDCAVGPDGALWFTLGGRGSQGSVHRIVHSSMKPDHKSGDKDQPLAAWSKIRHDGATSSNLIVESATPLERKARYTYLAGVDGAAGIDTIITSALTDREPLIRRLGCEAAIRQGIEPKLKDLKPLLGDDDRFVRTAARLVLQRIDPAKWANDLIGDENDRIAHEAIIALCKIDQANAFTEKIFERLHDKTPGETVEQLLEWTRTIQLALIHCKDRPMAVRGIALECRDLFPHADKFVNRELAIVLTECARTKEINQGVVTKLLAALRDAKDDRAQQIHFFYCLRLIKNDWQPEQKSELLRWFESTKTWSGGASYNGFLQNILRDALDLWSPMERLALIDQAETMPMTALAMLRAASPDQLPAPERLHQLLTKLDPKTPRANDLRTAFLDGLARSAAPDAPRILRQIADSDPAMKLQAIRALTRHATVENAPYFLQTIPLAQGGAVEFLDALKKNPFKPKPEDAASFRMVLLSAGKLPPQQKWKVVELLRHWTNGRSFGADKATEWKSELTAWGKWFGQSFPKEASLPDVSEERTVESKWKQSELLAYLEKDPRGIKGDALKGKLAFTKSKCINCHKYGPEGEGIGPDLTMVSKRFKRAEILEAILDPSKVISDQYRSSTISTLDGRTFTGLAAVQGDTITILLQDGTKSMIKGNNVESRYASLVSVMPEKLMDELTKEEIADLFAYLESTPPEKK